MTDLNPYTIPAKPVVYKGVHYRSTLEYKTAVALERLGLDFEHESQRYGGDDGGLYTPDFKILSVAVIGWPGFTTTDLYVETRPTMLDDRFRRKAEWNAATLKLSTDKPLLFVGLREFPAALLGWCYGVKDEAVLGVIGQKRNLTIDGNEGLPEPCLYVATAAQIWIDGFSTTPKDEEREYERETDY